MNTDIAASATDDSNDGVWSKDIEEAFEEALAIYPPCGRRKIILSDEGKMYGRNELIARYIKMRTGKTRSRKQVSSHIQVLARKKQRELQSKMKANPEAAHQIASTFSGMSSAEIVSQTVVNADAMQRDRMQALSFSGTPSKEKQESERFWPAHAAAHGNVLPGFASGGSMPRPLFNEHFIGTGAAAPMTGFSASPSSLQIPDAGGWQLQPQVPKLRIVLDHFSAFAEQGSFTHNFVSMKGSSHFADPGMENVDVLQVFDKFPGLREMYQQGPKSAFFLLKFWGDLAYPVGAMIEAPKFGISICYESLESFTLECSIHVISLGKQVVEKVQIEYPRHESGRFVYNFDRSEMCAYMVSFIEKLRRLDSREYANRVLENFSVILVARNHLNGEVLFVTACLFEANAPGSGPRTHIYKLVDAQDDTGRRYTA